MPLPNGIRTKDVKFLGIVQSFDEEKKFGLVASDEAFLIWGSEIYAYKDVLTQAGVSVGDQIRFGVHVNTRGQPQVSLPAWKVDALGQPIGVEEGEIVINVEEAVMEDPTFLEQLKDEIESRSAAQNERRSGGGGDAWGGGPAAKRPRTEAWGGSHSSEWSAGGKGGNGSWNGGPGMKGGGTVRASGVGEIKGDGKGMKGFGGPFGSPGYGGGFGKGGKGGKAGDFFGTMKGGMGKGCKGGGKMMKGGMGGGAGQSGYEGVTLFVRGLPGDVQRREVAQIFRQYSGLVSLRLAPKGDHAIAFVTFETHDQAQFVLQALDNYAFDEEDESTYLQLQMAKSQTRTL